MSRAASLSCHASAHGLGNSKIVKNCSRATWRKHNSRSRRYTSHGSAFTAIELVGVLTVVSLLAAAVIPQVIKKIDRAAWTRETADLNTMASSLTQRILRTKTVPDFTGIPAALANEMSLPTNAITTTPRGYARVFLTDPNFDIGGAGLPYNQTTNGSPTKPANARFIILSSQARALPISSSNSLSTNEFQAIWDTLDGAKRSTPTWSSWAGNGADLLIKKLDLQPLFYQLILVNHDTANPAYFSIDSTNTSVVPTAPRGLGWDRYYLDGTVLGLHDPNGIPKTKYLLKQSISFTFEFGAWSGGLQSGQSIDPMASAFSAQAWNFYHAPTNNVSNNGGASVFSALVLMYSFLYDYTLWAEECPHFNDHGTTSSPEMTLLNSVVGPSLSGSLGAVTGSGGLLK